LHQFNSVALKSVAWAPKGAVIRGRILERAPINFEVNANFGGGIP
jgi:hypothetical protein